MALRKVSYALEDGTAVEFEFEPGDDWHQVASGAVIAKVKDAVRPAVESAKVVLDEVNRLAPGDVAVKFGIKVTGFGDLAGGQGVVGGEFRGDADMASRAISESFCS